MYQNERARLKNPAYSIHFFPKYYSFIQNLIIYVIIFKRTPGLATINVHKCSTCMGKIHKSLISKYMICELHRGHKFIARQYQDLN